MGHYLLVRSKCFLQTHGLSKKGQGMVEYALIIAFVVVIAAGLVNSDTVKNKIINIFNSLGSTLDNATGAGAGTGGAGTGGTGTV